MQKNFLQWFAVFITLSTLLISIGVFKAQVDNQEKKYNDHCLIQNDRDKQNDAAINKLALTTERLIVLTEVLNKNVDELKQEIKRRK